MKRFFGLLFFSIALLLTSALFAQTGSVRGNISETFAGATEPIIGAIINIEGTTKATVTDTSGHFFIDNVPVGVYNVKVSYIGYDPKIVKGVEVRDGQTANLPKILLNEDATTTEEVEIIGTRDKSTDMAMIQEIKTLDVVASGISSEQIKKTMDRDASDVAKRVAGVSVVDNRFVIVRGLSERYNAVMLNDVLAPSFEQDVKSFSLDNIQSSYIDRLIVYKSPSADLPGDFAGGVVKIFTKGMPVKNNFSIGFSSSYRQGTTGQDFKKMPEGKKGWLGYDDGTYGFPDNIPTDYNEGKGLNYDAIKIGQKFRSDTWVPTQVKADPDIRFNLSGGLRIKLGGTKLLGLVSGINYSKTHEKWQDAKQSLFGADQNFEFGSESKFGELGFLYADNIDFNAKTVRINALQNFVLQLNTANTIEFKNLYTHAGVNRYRNSYNYLITNPAMFYTDPDKISYNSDRNLTNSFGGIYSSQLVGKHTIVSKIDLNWTVGYARADRDEPDFKNFGFILRNGEYIYKNTNENANPVNFGRLFYKTQEDVRTISLDLTKKTIFNLFGLTELSVKGGWYLEEKERAFYAKTFSYSASQPLPSTSEGITHYNNFIDGLLMTSPEDFNQESKWNNYNGMIIIPGLQSGTYSATMNQYSFYGMTKINWREKVNVSGGMRLENYTRIIGGDQLYVQSWLPSINMSYNFNKKLLARGSFGKTVNRPEAREAAGFSTYDFYLRTMVNGNPNLKPASINNFDIRMEFYPSSEEAFSVGVFYKDFTNPIERVLARPLGIDPYQLSEYEVNYLNASKAYSRGVEFEARKSFKKILFVKGKDILSNFSVIFNSAILESKIIYQDTELQASGIPALTVTTGNENSGEVWNNRRSMGQSRSLVGQSPYMVNAGLNYDNSKTKTMVNVSYNVFGKRLFLFIPGLATIYEVPRHVLDLTISQKIGKFTEVKFGIQDILNQKIQFIQDLDQDGKVKRMKGTNYESDPSKSNAIGGQGLGGGWIGTTPQSNPESPFVSGDTQFLGFKRGSYFTLGVTFKF